MIEIFGFGKSKHKKQNKDNKDQKQTSAKNNSHNNSDSQKIPHRLSKCEDLLKGKFFDSNDVIFDIFETAKDKAMIVYIDGLTNKDITDRDIIKPLKSPDFNGNVALAITASYKVIDNISAVIFEITNGNVAVFYESNGKAFIIDLKQWDKRSVETPDSETVIRGPKEGFNENIRTNTALIRRKIRNPALIFENITLGTQTNTQISLVYINGIVNQDVLKELRSRLSKINTDSILESGYIEHFIDNNKFNTVSGIGVTQKPDIVAARILEGRVAVLCDGTPHALTVPELFIENLHTSEDYYNRSMHATLIRLLRLMGLFIGVLLPGLSVAFITYNPETIPPVFLTQLISSTQNTPLPSGAEAFFLILMFELLRESGARLPKVIGSAMTIVGSLIIGQSAVNAGIVGAPMVIIIALTAVSSFITPSLTEFILIYRLFFLMLGSTMGLIGIGAGVFISLAKLISTESFGIPILSSFSKNEIKDSIMRFPLPSMKLRPISIAKDNVQRME